MDGSHVVAFGPHGKSETLIRLIESWAKNWPTGSVDFYYLPDPRDGFVWLQDGGKWRLITMKGRQLPLKTV